MSWRKYLLIPRLTLASIGAPRSQTRAWERYWDGISRLGPDGDVLWDADEPAEAEMLAAMLSRHADPGLPMVDLGCGSGRQVHALTKFGSRVIGIDGSAAAVARAGSGAAVVFRVADIASGGLGERLHDEIGDANVHIRGVLHVLDDDARRAVAANIAALLGERGTLYLCETNHTGDPLDYLLDQGARPTRLPPLVHRLIRAGVRAPRRFGPEEVAQVFPAGGWETVEQGATEVYGIPLEPGGPVQRIPAWYAVVRTSRRPSRR
ncbi:class I SAM-dependent methyltransferase [Actinoplanes solisilvae]|uniref:class I SAM-dependent methyltransferase n=1 Tax=Actinoplanes solisilvae TaxID=2486853 RepID=UPI000FDB411B|nr:class I SAM-dependent methyltransferase [Actinoplanes solisilvae]